MSENKQALQVAALKNGTVIDHIPSEKALHRSATARRGTNDKQYHHRIQPRQQEAG